jgi:penicillin-binding protein 1A
MAFFGRKKSRSKPARNQRGKAQPRSAGRQRRSSRRRNKPLIFVFMSWAMTLGLWVAIIMAATTAYVFVGLDKQGLFKVPDREPGMMLLSADGHVVAESGSLSLRLRTGVSATTLVLIFKA